MAVHSNAQNVAFGYDYSNNTVKVADPKVSDRLCKEAAKAASTAAGKSGKKYKCMGGDSELDCELHNNVFYVRNVFICLSLLQIRA